MRAQWGVCVCVNAGNTNYQCFIFILPIEAEAQPHVPQSVCVCQDVVTWALTATFPLKHHLLSCSSRCTRCLQLVHDNNEMLLSSKAKDLHVHISTSINSIYAPPEFKGMRDNSHTCKQTQHPRGRVRECGAAGVGAVLKRRWCLLRSWLSLLCIPQRSIAAVCFFPKGLNYIGDLTRISPR